MRCRSCGTTARTPRSPAPSIAKFLEEGLTAEKAFVGNQDGDVKAAIAGAAKKVEAVYSYPYQNHAPMEPMNATALYTADKCEVWGGTQNGEAAFAAVIAASGLPADKCEVHKMMLGGGFGRRGAASDYVRQAVHIAKQMPGTPIKLLWSREEDMTHGRYHPITQCKLVGAFDKDNNLTGLHMRISGQSILAPCAPQRLEPDGRDPVTFQGLNPARRDGVRLHRAEPADRPRHAQPARPGGLLARREHQPERDLRRMLHGRARPFGRRQDALEFRRKLMTKHPKNLAVLNAVAEKIGWGKPTAAGPSSAACRT